MFDVIIIGAGVNGCAIARELSRLELRIAVLDKCADVCEGTSKANSGIVHAGYDAMPGTLKAKLNVEGSRLMEALSRELDFPYKRNGSMVLCFDKEGLATLTELKERGEANGVEGIEILSGDQVRKLEPSVSSHVVAALHAPSGAIVCPFGLTIALAENAAVNGVEFLLQREVTAIEKTEKGFRVFAGEESLETEIVINAAGVYADQIHNMVSSDRMEIRPRRGEYLLCDKETGGLVSHTLFQLPTSLGKGILVTPTVHGNLLLGPTALDLEDKEDTDTSGEGLSQVQAKAALSVEKLPADQVITSFAGLRAHVIRRPKVLLNAGRSGDEDISAKEGDFVIGEAADAPGFIDVAGMESPGLSCAPAVGKYVAAMVEEMQKPSHKKNFISERKGIASMALASVQEKARLLEENPAYGNVVCRCEMVTEGEILDAIHRPLGATTTDGIKRRTRAGMGRCGSGFCNPRVVELLARELGVDESRITKSQDGSWYLLPEEGGSHEK